MGRDGRVGGLDRKRKQVVTGGARTTVVGVGTREVGGRMEEAIYNTRVSERDERR